MVEISNTKVYDLRESVIASRNAMRLTPPEYNQTEFDKAIERAKKLASCGGGSGHSNFRKGIRVSFDIKYPGYFTPELQRYSFMDIVTSSSKMHRLVRMDLDLACNKYVTSGAIKMMKQLVAVYNRINDTKESDFKGEWFVLRDKTEIFAEKKGDALYYAFMRCISNCPQGIELFMRCSTNYEQLATIYRQRLHHRLKEDWQKAFCHDFIENLPYAKELIICNEE